MIRTIIVARPGDPGEIIVLGHLFRALDPDVEFGVGGAMPIANGSLAAAAGLADVVLARRGPLLLAKEGFAVAAEPIRAPFEHYEEALERPATSP